MYQRDKRQREKRKRERKKERRERERGLEPNSALHKNVLGALVANAKKFVSADTLKITQSVMCD